MPEERSTLWPKIVADHTNYAGYQAKTDREFSLVLLTPRRLTTSGMGISGSYGPPARCGGTENGKERH